MTALPEDSVGPHQPERGNQAAHGGLATPGIVPSRRTMNAKASSPWRAVQILTAHGRVSFVSVWGCMCQCDFLRRAALRTFPSRSLQVLGAEWPGAGLLCLRIMLPSPDFSERNSEERMRDTAILFVLMNLAVISYTI